MSNVPLSGADAPLRGLVVADFSVTLPGPYCSQLLRRLGARVIHVEPPGGDPVRDVSDLFAALSEGKESVVVDLRLDADRALALAITDDADIVVEGWRPGVAERLGVGPATVLERNPGAVYCSISGYGQVGELAMRAGHDINYVAEAGALDAVERIGLPIADLGGATFAALRVVAATLHAARTGEGQHLDVSLAGAVRDWVEAVALDRTSTPLPTVHGLPHYGSFVTADGATLTLGVVFEQRLWQGLALALGRPDWCELDAGARTERAGELRAAIAATVASTTAAELERRLGAVDTCWAMARPPDADVRVEGRLARRAGDVPALDQHGECIRREFSGTLEGADR